MSQKGPSTSKRRKYNARIPPPRVKKVLQSDEEIGRMNASVPVLLSRSMEHFAEQLLVQGAAISDHLGAKTLAPLHLKHAIQDNPVFSRFLGPLVAEINEAGGRRRAIPESSGWQSATSTSAEVSAPGTSGAANNPAASRGRGKRGAKTGQSASVVFRGESDGVNGEKKRRKLPETKIPEFVSFLPEDLTKIPDKKSIKVPKNDDDGDKNNKVSVIKRLSIEKAESGCDNESDLAVKGILDTKTEPGDDEISGIVDSGSANVGEKIVCRSESVGQQV